MNHLAKLELAWAAGFFDGEGTVCFCATIQASIGQVNRSNLERFQRAVKVGHISGPYSKGGRPISSWRAYSDEAITCIRRLACLLGEEKRSQFLKAMVRYCFRTVRHRGSSPTCRRGHIIAQVGRYDGDCMECRRLRRAGLEMPPILDAPTAFSLRLHGIREYSPQKNYEPTIQT